MIEQKTAEKRRRLNVVRTPNPPTEITFLKKWGPSPPGTKAKPPKSIADVLVKAQLARFGWAEAAPAVAPAAPVQTKTEEKHVQTPGLSLPKPKGK